MAEVSIKAHTRRGKEGKVIQVRSYSRRVGRKGVHSPKREKSEQPGEELEKRIAEKEQPKKQLTQEELDERREVLEELRNSTEQDSRGKQKRENRKTKSSRIKEPLSVQGSLGILERVEDKIAKFVEKYSKKKYKRQL